MSASSERSQGALRDLVTSAESERAFTESGWWSSETLIDRLRRHAEATPTSEAVIDGLDGRRVTFAELLADATRVATYLEDPGIDEDDVVAMQLPNWYASVAIALGALMRGAVINPMLPIYRARELRYMLGLARTKLIFTPSSYRDFDHVDLISQLRAELPDLHHHVVIEPGGEDFAQLFGGTKSGTQRDVVAGNVCELMFTSGTEAEPKGIMHSERTLNANAKATAMALGLTSEDVVWMPAPIGHSTGFNHGMRLAVYLGLKLVLQDRWEPYDASRLVACEQCSHTLLATTFLRDLIAARRDGAEDVSSLRLFGCGGAPVPPEVVRAAAEQGIGCLRLYGATEVLVATWNRPGDPNEKREYSEGRPLDGVEIQVRDDRGRAVIDEPGELFVRSPSGCVGFFNDAERMRSSFGEDGFIRSGDIGVLDGDGYFAISGRKKEIIIRGGLNIAPREIEDLLLQVVGVRQAAVVGLPDERLGEITCACLVVEERTSLTLDDVIERLRSMGLATFKLPQRLQLMDQLPMTATGKIRKHVLVAELTKG